MATTREQAEAYGYANRRMSTTLLRGTDEARLDPRRRLNRTLGGGVAVGILIMAGFGIVGWLGGGSGPDLPTDGAVAVGDSSYVVVDGTVHEALNLSSALLAGRGDLTEVRQETLDEAPRGLPVGIPRAPDALPDADDLLEEDWTLCATPAETGGGPPEQTALYVSVPGVAPHAKPEAGGGATVLVKTEDGGLWLLTNGRRYAMDSAIRDLLNLPREPVRLPREIIATVPEGPEITIPEPGPGSGREPTADLPFDARVGDVARTEEGGTGRQYFVVRPDGLLAVSELVHTLLSGGAGRSHEISISDAARAQRSQERSEPGDPAWPKEVPRAAELERSQPVCVSTPPGSEPGDAPWQATVHLPQTMPEPEGTTPVEATGGVPLGLLDQIYVPAGSGALVRVTASAGGGGTYTLVTDTGMAYPLSSREAVELLGYDPDLAPSMPRAYMDLLPAGPLLDPEAATQEQRGEHE
jgi:type VII secretion protein EccB